MQLKENKFMNHISNRIIGKIPGSRSVLEKKVRYDIPLLYEDGEFVLYEGHAYRILKITNNLKCFIENYYTHDVLIVEAHELLSIISNQCEFYKNNQFLIDLFYEIHEFLYKCNSKEKKINKAFELGIHVGTLERWITRFRKRKIFLI